MTILTIVFAIAIILPYLQAFTLCKSATPCSHIVRSNKLLMSTVLSYGAGSPLDTVLKYSIQLADTSISDEDILDITGQVSDLPNPLYAVGFALLLLAGIAALQFSLGDLTKEVSDCFRDLSSSE